MTAKINSEGGETSEVRYFISCREARKKNFPKPFVNTGRLRACIGFGMSSSTKTKAVYEMAKAR